MIAIRHYQFASHYVSHLITSYINNSKHKNLSIETVGSETTLEDGADGTEVVGALLYRLARLKVAAPNLRFFIRELCAKIENIPMIKSLSEALI